MAGTTPETATALRDADLGAGHPDESPIGNPAASCELRNPGGRGVVQRARGGAEGRCSFHSILVVSCIGKKHETCRRQCIETFDQVGDEILVMLAAWRQPDERV